MTRSSSPIELGIETVNYCNARCCFCPLFQGAEPLDRNIRPVTTMGRELFTKICREVGAWEEKPKVIYLNMDGEPLIDPMFAERLEVLKEYDLISLVYIQTNGQAMDAEKAEQIASSGVNSIFYALDGATPGIYEAMRVGCKFDEVFANLKEFASVRDRLGSKTCINVKYVRTAKNEHEVEQCYDMVSEFLKPGQDSFHDTISVDWAVEGLASDEAILNRVTDKDVLLKRKGGCTSLSSMLVVHADGRVPACCWDYNLAVNGGRDFGNANEESLHAIWHGQKLAALRDGIAKDVIMDKCSKCPLLYEKPESEMPRPKIAREELIGTAPGYGYIYQFAK